jgi:hypothetical protein
MSTAAATLSNAPATTQQPHRRLRSIGAVLAGLVAIAVTSTATDALMRAIGVFPADAKPMSDALFLLAAAYRAVFGIAGTYLTARLAPAKPLQHALVLGAIGVVLSTVGAIAMWNAGTHWYALANIAIPLPAAFLGARLHRARS